VKRFARLVMHHRRIVSAAAPSPPGPIVPLEALPEPDKAPAGIS
jgi:hypothetical protein